MSPAQRYDDLIRRYGSPCEEFRADLLRHLEDAAREARDGCRRAAELRAQTARAVGDDAGARAAADVADLIREGRLEP
jgi:hypothetical protein